MNLKSIWQRFFMQAHPLRAWLEMAFLGVAMLVAVNLVSPRLAEENRQNMAFVAMLSAVSLFGLRLKPYRGRWYLRILVELFAGGMLALMLTMLLTTVGAVLQSEVVAPPPAAGLMAIDTAVLGAVIHGGPFSETHSSVILAIFFSCGVAFFTMRIGSALLIFWNRLQRRHLIWSLTNSHLLLVVVGSVLVAGLLTLQSLQYITTYATETDMLPLVLLVDLVPIVVVFTVMTLILLAFVLPPSIVLSYFAARRTTRRLKTLTAAATALRTGHYDVRVPVSGEDEVAHLQTDFNMMAADLEAAMHDLQTERDAVAALLRSRRELVANVSHELRTPVAILRGHQDLLLENPALDPVPDMRRDIEIMSETTHNLQRLIDDLFTLSRAEVGQLELRPQPVCVPALIQRCVEAIAPVMWQSSRVQVIAEVALDLPPALADETRLEQIVHNLLRNSARHTPPGGIVAVSASQADGQIALQVRDTGEGISAEDLPHLWERFYRAASARSQDSSGVGLGLALVKELAEAMGGTVAAESTPGQGSCFSINLPRAD